jgi:hypothetical protein
MLAATIGIRLQVTLTRSSVQVRAAPQNGWRKLSTHFDENASTDQMVSKALGTTEPIAFTNYDVLFAPPSSSSLDDGDKVPKYTLINHVGNRRFLVLLNINRPRYFDADEQGDEAECERIALEIIKTVRQQCVPRGRFLQQDAENQWREINEVASLVSIVEGEITKNVPSSKNRELPAKRAHPTTSNNLEIPFQAATKKFPKEFAEANQFSEANQLISRYCKKRILDKVERQNSHAQKIPMRVAYIAA